MTFSDPVMVDVLTSVGEEKTPSSYALLQNYPNPFNPSTKIDFALKSAGFATLTVYNLLGQEVARLVNGIMPAGRHSVEFNPKAGGIPSGMYFYSLTSGPFSETRKMVIMK